MSETAKQELNQLKSELQQAELDFKKQDQLLRKREELEIEIEKLEQSHLFVPSDKKSFLKEMKSKRQQIDTILDMLDEDNDQKISRLRTLIKEKTLTLYPERLATFVTLSRELDSIKSEKLLVQEVSLQITSLIAILSKALEARQKIKRLGLFSYIFGENPTITISIHLKNAETQAGLLLSLFSEQLIDNLPFTQFLNIFQEECRKRWSFKHIDTFVFKAEKQLQQFLIESEEKRELISEKYRKKHKELDELLE